jgi:hypothetical protein
MVYMKPINYFKKYVMVLNKKVYLKTF